jgi:hypothetical protein
MQFENGSEILASAPIYAEEEKVINESEWGAIRTTVRVFPHWLPHCSFLSKYDL